MTGSGRGVTRAPFRRAAEVSMHDEACICLGFLDLDFLTLDEVGVAPRANAGPGHSPVRKLSHGRRGPVGEDARDFLVCPPIGALYRVEEMQGGVVSFGLHAVAECGLHAALSRAAVAAARRNQGEKDHVQTLACRFDGGSLSSEPSSYDQHVGALYRFHRSVSQHEFERGREPAGEHEQGHDAQSQKEPEDHTL
jgi:hypothetical protein